MSVANGNKIRDCVSVHDVAQVLGVGSNDVGTLCTSTNINKWAKYRPLEPQTQKKVGLLTDAERALVNWGIKNIPLWHNKTIGHVVNYWMGLDTSSTNAPDGYTDEPAGGWWAIQLPSTAFRLADFICTSNTEKGYFHGAMPPIGGIEETAVDISTKKVSIKYKTYPEGVTEGLAITFADLSVMRNYSYQNLYFGVLIYAQHGTNKATYLATQDNPVGDLSTTGATLWSMGAVVRFNVSSTATDPLNLCTQNSTPIKVAPILSSVKAYFEGTAITAANATTKGTFVALQPAEELTFSIPAVYANINALDAWKDKTVSTRYIYYMFRLTCSVDVVHYFLYNLHVMDASNTVIASKENQSVTIPAGESVEINSNIDAGQYYSAATEVLLEVRVNPNADDATNTRDTTRYISIGSERSRE